VGEAEIAFFVQQAYRRRGIGTALVKALLRWAEQRGWRRVWAMSVAENVLAMRLLQRCGFCFLKYVLPGIELDIELSAGEQGWFGVDRIAEVHAK
jgi:GNAT superfamily N-acetyltransferase